MSRINGLLPDGVEPPRVIDPFMPKIEEWVERSNGKVWADVAFDKLRGLGFGGLRADGASGGGGVEAQPPP